MPSAPPPRREEGYPLSPAFETVRFSNETSADHPEGVAGRGAAQGLVEPAGRVLRGSQAHSFDFRKNSARDSACALEPRVRGQMLRFSNDPFPRRGERALAQARESSRFGGAPRLARCADVRVSNELERAEGEGGRVPPPRRQSAAGPRYTRIVRWKSSLFSQRVRFVESSSGCVRPALSCARETSVCSPAGSAGISSVKNVHA